jgi:hypothetical protein
MKCFWEYFFDFLVGLLATGVGVFLALYAQMLYERYKQNKETEEIKIKIKKELEEAIETIKDISTRSSEIFLSPIKTPVFKAYVNSTKVTLLDKYQWYNNLLIVYKYIDDLNLWHNLKAEKSFDNNTDYLEKINDGLKIVENNILVSNVINEM